MNASPRRRGEGFRLFLAAQKSAAIGPGGRPPGPPMRIFGKMKEGRGETRARPLCPSLPRELLGGASWGSGGTAVRGRLGGRRLRPQRRRLRPRAERSGAARLSRGAREYRARGILCVAGAGGGRAGHGLSGLEFRLSGDPEGISRPRLPAGRVLPAGGWQGEAESHADPQTRCGDDLWRHADAGASGGRPAAQMRHPSGLARLPSGKDEIPRALRYEPGG